MRMTPSTNTAVCVLLTAGLLIVVTSRVIGEESHCSQRATDANAKKVVLACEEHWETNKSDCNKFLKAVAGDLGVVGFTEEMNADLIIDFLEGQPSNWTKLEQGSHLKAHEKAVAGKFVVAGLKSSDMSREHGHVAIVTAGDLVLSGMDEISYPRGYWGTLGATGKECTGLNFSFPAPHRKEKLRYYWRSLP